MTIGRGSVTIGRGSVTIGRGMVTIGRGTVTIGCGLVTIGRGTAMIGATSSGRDGLRENGQRVCAIFTGDVVVSHRAHLSIIDPIN